MSKRTRTRDANRAFNIEVSIFIITFGDYIITKNDMRQSGPSQSPVTPALAKQVPEVLAAQRHAIPNERIGRFASSRTALAMTG